MNYLRSIGGKMLIALMSVLLIASIPIIVVQMSAKDTSRKMDVLLDVNLPLMTTAAEISLTAQRVAANVEAALRQAKSQEEQRSAITRDIGSFDTKLVDLRTLNMGTPESNITKAIAQLRANVVLFSGAVVKVLQTHDERNAYTFFVDGRPVSALDHAVALRLKQERVATAIEEMIRFGTRFPLNTDVAKSDIEVWAQTFAPADATLKTIFEHMALQNDRLYKGLNQIIAAPDEEKSTQWQKLRATWFTRLTSSLDSVQALVGPIFERISSQEVTDSDAMQSAQRALRFDIEQLEAAAQVSFADTRHVVRDIQARSDVRSMVGMGIGGLAVLLLSAWMTQHLSRPISRLVEAMSRLARGDTNLQLDGTARKDEIGGMFRAVEVFRGTSLARRDLEQQAENERERQGLLEERTRREAERLEEAGRLEIAIRSLGEGLQHLAGGKMFFRIEEQLTPSVETLRVDFNAAMEKMQSALAEVGASAGEIHIGAGEIAGVAEDLSRRTEQQAANLEETAAALDQITLAVGKTADGAGYAHKVVATAKSNAEEAGAVVGEAIDAINRIETSSHKIGQIIVVIDEIAFQTNLLALNAGVEAARAGDAGRGFAVVAQEVRALAQRSAEAAREIKVLISASKSEVDQGVDRVTKTGQALERIVSQVGEINLAVSEIADSAKMQAQRLQEINGAVNNMDQVTQRNAAIVEEATATSRTLTAQTEKLDRLMNGFSLGTPSRHVPSAPSIVKPAGPAPRPAPTRAAPARKSVPAPARKSVPAPARSAARPIPALKVTAQAVGDDDWSEF